MVFPIVIAARCNLYCLCHLMCRLLRDGVAAGHCGDELAEEAKQAENFVAAA